MILGKIRTFLGIFKDAAYGWADDDVPAMAAAIAYHAILSLAPLLIVLIGTISLIFGADTVESEVVTQIETAVGPKAADAVRSIIQATERSTRETVAVGGSSLALFLLFSTGVFKQLIGSLNSIWGLSDDARRGFTGGILRMIRRHFLAFLMLISLALWLYLLLISRTLTIFPEKLFIESFPEMVDFMPHIPLLVSPIIFTLVFAVLFAVLPDRKIPWSDVWFGSAFTAILTVITEKLIGLYLQKTIVTSLYGAAGSVIIVLLWIYWTAVVFLFGAELAKAYSKRCGSLSKADDDSIDQDEVQDRSPLEQED
ncbi:MAG TPA: YihY/virulence factor BrkB family protein [Candidatus Krumholzibacterium sp.]|nr:YihY/virulence factor BrkB family protein [Candidatus Krumholzibacterium sp.]